jgi:hypothetical protein
MLRQQLYWLIGILTIFSGGILPSLAIEPSQLPVADFSKTGQPVDDQFTAFPCGLNLGKRSLLSSMIVRGKEDGEKAINFSEWSIPFNVLTQTLKIQTKTLANGSIELRSSAAVSVINPDQLNTYPELGLAIKIKDLQKYLGIKAEFDLNDYAIKLTLPEAFSSSPNSTIPENPLVFDGLEVKAPENFNLAAIEQRIGFNNTNQSSQQIKATGTAFGSSWYLQLTGDAKNILDLSLNDAQIVKYSDFDDYIVGGQSAFWNRQNSGSYWGLTKIWRQGFTPQLSATGTVSTSERTQANKVGRSVVGVAAAGTLVRLLPATSNQAIAEVLVDGTGVFRFDNVPVTNGDRYYRLWLFANGQLSTAPEVREVNFVTVPGQLPTGATATLASVGLRRENKGLLGDFSDVRGAVVSHWGVAEWLTVGAGVSVDQGVQGIGEVYLQPNGIPLEIAASIRTGAAGDVLANINWQPANNLKFDGSIDRLSHRLKGDWQLSPQLSLTSTYDSRDALGVGFDYRARNGSDNFTYLQANFDTNAKLRWRLEQQFGQWDLQNQGNEAGTISSLTYALNQQRELGSAIYLTYQTNQVNPASEFGTVSWRYRSSNRSPWELDLGYGLGSSGGGWIAGGGVNILPGVNLRGRYQTGINNAGSSFSLELVSNLETQNGLRENPQRLENLRTHGGIEIVPFFDTNSNGQQDAGEKTHLDIELINLNHRPLKFYRPLVTADRITTRVAPSKYLLDFDPSGFPPNWRTKTTGYTVEVAAGSYTKVLVPLVPSYNIEGVVRDIQGNPIAGAKVELISSNGGDKIFSISSRDGGFYLESIDQGNYQLEVNGHVTTPAVVNLNAASPLSQTLNLQTTN